jgi:hypothetical protein
MYEHRRHGLLPLRAFLLRFASHLGVSSLVIAGSLAIGTIGYHGLARQDWTDAFLNASMILSGMGPVGELGGTAGKLFAAFYALYSGLVLIVVTGILLAPILHRVLHRLHLDQEG